MKIKICPKCGSIELESFGHYSAPKVWRCKKCGFENEIFPEIESSKLQKLQKDLAQNSIRNKKIGKKSNNNPKN